MTKEIIRMLSVFLSRFHFVFVALLALYSPLPSVFAISSWNKC